MAGEKITITIDDLHSPDVEQKLERAQAIEEAHKHYVQQQAAAPPMVNAGKASFMYNAAVYMAIFGLIGGLLAWGLSEGFTTLVPNRYMQMQEMDNRRVDVIAQLQEGSIMEMQAESQLLEIYADYPSNPYAQILSDVTLTAEQQSEAIGKRLELDALPNFVHRFVWYTVVGVMFAFLLAVAEPMMTRNRRGVVLNGAVGIGLSLVGAAVIGLFINKIYHLLGGGTLDASFIRQVVARGVVWAVFGMFITIAPAVVMKSSKKLVIGIIGGALGGFLGGLLFDPIDVLFNSASLSRLLAFVTIGFLSGMATGLIESAAKTGWLKVTGGVITGKQFIIYRNPTFLGSSPACEIYLFKDPRVSDHHAAIHQSRNGYEIEDLNDEPSTYINGELVERTRLRAGDEIQIGSSTFCIQERKQSVAIK
ncbi:MAG: FHA domain-containing protein [Phycisphaeraceae bacterium]|nr:FHA domain-containing protein [Phycisphaeraceae bacterium]